jgi:hypothetical protein
LQSFWGHEGWSILTFIDSSACEGLIAWIYHSINIFAIKHCHCITAYLNGTTQIITYPHNRIRTYCTILAVYARLGLTTFQRQYIVQNKTRNVKKPQKKQKQNYNSTKQKCAKQNVYFVIVDILKATMTIVLTPFQKRNSSSYHRREVCT